MFGFVKKPKVKPDTTTTHHTSADSAVTPRIDYYPSGRIKCETLPYYTKLLTGIKTVSYYETGGLYTISYRKPDYTAWNPEGRAHFEGYLETGEISQYQWHYWLDFNYTGPGSMQFLEDGSVYRQTYVYRGVVIHDVDVSDLLWDQRRVITSSAGKRLRRVPATTPVVNAQWI